MTLIIIAREREPASTTSVWTLRARVKVVVRLSIPKMDFAEGSGGYERAAEEGASASYVQGNMELQRDESPNSSQEYSVPPRGEIAAEIAAVSFGGLQRPSRPNGGIRYTAAAVAAAKNIQQGDYSATGSGFGCCLDEAEPVDEAELDYEAYGGMGSESYYSGPRGSQQGGGGGGAAADAAVSSRGIMRGTSGAITAEQPAAVSHALFDHPRAPVTPVEGRRGVWPASAASSAPAAYSASSSSAGRAPLRENADGSVERVSSRMWKFPAGKLAKLKHLTSDVCCLLWLLITEDLIGLHFCCGVHGEQTRCLSELRDRMAEYKVNHPVLESMKVPSKPVLSRA